MSEISLGVLVILLVTASWYDVKSYRIPNWLILAGLVLGMLSGLWHGEWAGMLTAIKGCAVGMAVLLPLYWLRAMGAGDVKLMAVVGAFLGPVDVFSAVIATFLAGGVLAILLALWTKKLKSLLQNTRLVLLGGAVKMSARQAPVMNDFEGSAGKLPYGVAITLGTLGLLAWQRLVQ